MSKITSAERAAKARYQKARERRDPMLSQVLAELDGIPAAKIARKTGISPSTINNWRKMGGTRNPQHKTMEFALRTVGMYFAIVAKDKT